MRTLSKRRLNNATEVKLWQAWLNQFYGEELSVDGKFGAKTESATKRYQRSIKQKEDGIVGPITQTHAGFRLTKNNKIVMLEIPFSKIIRSGVLLRDGKAYSCKKFADETGYKIVWNGAFFELKSGKIVQFISLAGKVMQYGMANSGIAYPNATNSPPVWLTRNEAINKPYDLQVGSPVLIQNFARNIDQTGISNAIMTNKTRRGCTGLTKNSIVLAFSISNVTLYDMLNEGLYQRLMYFLGNDGGGSQCFYMGGAYVITTDGRSIPACVGLEVRC